MKTNKKGNKRKPVKSSLIWGYVFLTPWILYMLIFLMYPFFHAISDSFLSFDAINKNNIKFMGIKNWITVLQDKMFWLSIRNIVYNQAIFIGVSFVIALISAVLLSGIKRGAAIFRTIYFLPVITSITVSMMLFSFLFNSSGPVQGILVKLGLLAKPVLWQFSKTLPMPMIALFSCWKWFGIQMIIFLGGIASIDQTIFEAAGIDGAGKIRQFFSITLPLLRPQMVFVITMNIINGMQMFTEVYMTFDLEGGPHNAALTPVLYLYKNAFKDMDMGYASAIGMILAVLIFLVTVLQMKVTDKEVV